MLFKNSLCHILDLFGLHSLCLPDIPHHRTKRTERLDKSTSQTGRSKRASHKTRTPRRRKTNRTTSSQQGFSPGLRTRRTQQSQKRGRYKEQYLKNSWAVSAKQRTFQDAYVGYLQCGKLVQAKQPEAPTTAGAPQKLVTNIQTYWNIQMFLNQYNISSQS